MFSKVTSCALLGIEGTIISVEADVNDGLPMFTMVGYLSSSVKEAGERVRTALKNSGFHMPPKRITINLSPADIRKEGSGFDLPVAVAVLLSIGILPEFDVDLEKTIILGELGLNGEVKPIAGVLPMVSHCQKLGYQNFIVPKANAREASLIKGIMVYGVESLEETAEFIQGIRIIEPEVGVGEIDNRTDNDANVDFSEVKGQATLKRGMEIAAAGFHNVLMTGAAGAGKSMIAKRLPTIMPKLTFEECIDITKIYSVSGLLDNNNALITRRPFRSPHHTISSYALVGGGTVPRPGEISLAHNGVLFLDELPEFNKNVLEVMRQPIEDRNITISRVNATYVFPADFMLVAAMNQCPCGNYPNRRKCKCTPYEIRRYQGKISGPLLDRIDITMEVQPIEYKDLFLETKEESSEDIRQRVEEARLRQANRYREEAINFNSQLDGKILKKYITLKDAQEELLRYTFEKGDLSARGTYRILRLARTIADLAGSDDILIEHLTEAIFYKNNGKFYSEEV
ncbi:MAG: YifB family Mg chelatase-like AAA ATPase [Lachnospiraceae bacterium]|nr:YifB family Mg chelatase-like AAA ATPase [Lachnospiraceae bacterium]